jgi:hypothetical protein
MCLEHEDAGKAAHPVDVSQTLHDEDVSQQTGLRRQRDLRFLEPPSGRRIQEV